jgi:hypothetical protein
MKALGIAIADNLRSTVRMTAGEYANGISVTSGLPITIVGEGATLLPGGPNNIALDIQGGSVSVRGLVIQMPTTGDPGGSAPFICLAVLKLTDVTVQSKPLVTTGQTSLCTLTMSRVVFDSGGLVLSNGTTIVDRSTIFGGVVVAGGGKVTITNSLMSGFKVDASPSNDMDISFNTIVGTGVTTANPTLVNPSVAFQNNIIVNTGSGDAFTCAVCTASNNIVMPQGAALPGNIVADPIFVAPLQNDFHLQKTSPAIDAASALTTDHDFDGVARPQGTKPDIGAFEFH